MADLIGAGFSAAGDLLKGFGNAASDAGAAAAFGSEAEGDAAEATAYGQASKYALQNAEISKQSTKLQEFQTQRQVYQTIGAGQAAAGNNGVTGGGSAQDIMRSSAGQGALVNQVIGEQGIINETAYEEQGSQYTGMQKAALAAQQGAIAQQKAANQKKKTDIFGGILGAVGSILPFFL